ncbi:unnamed protein product [Spirodela intermedia]|uniref:Uncharacterized protein n=1 Tax=Spirodela intermedia TaxID=51605 RepID=A0A7I8J8A3_SPIIN|nr:unnamed protein product [Spirodela intermedia]CAA6665662.1 unnamed protein product [Spirodela intermedia]
MDCPSTASVDGRRDFTSRWVGGPALMPLLKHQTDLSSLSLSLSSHLWDVLRRLRRLWISDCQPQQGTITFPGISIVWGLVVMVMVYSVGHISGAHFNPAVTIAFATCGRFPWREVPAYISAQVVGSTLASGTLWLLFGGKHEHFPGTIPQGSNVQSFALEFIITFYLMFIGELAGLAVGATVLINVLFAGWADLGASMNPARSLGPAIVGNRYEAIWVYVVGRLVGPWGSLGVQSRPLHRQAPEGDLQERLLSEEPREEHLSLRRHHLKLRRILCHPRCPASTHTDVFRFGNHTQKLALY